MAAALAEATVVVLVTCTSCGRLFTTPNKAANICCVCHTSPPAVSDEMPPFRSYHYVGKAML